MILASDVAMWDAGIDYLRLTARRGESDTGIYDVYQSIAHTCMASATGGEVNLQDWTFCGYQGKICAGVAYGQSNQGYIFQASGGVAQYAAGYPVPWDNCPRIDIAITLWLKGYNPTVAQELGAIANVYRPMGGGKTPRPRYICGYGEGDTTYLGSRTSRRYIRVYDKGRESKGDDQYANAWRFEVECKDDLAPEVWEAASRSSHAPDWAANYVHTSLRGSGYILPRLAAQMRTMVSSRVKVASDEASRVAWLAKQVSPCVERLLAAGYKPEYLRELLGL